MSDRRLLIVEFLSTDRFSQYRSELLPFVRGFAEERGVAVRWICFGFDPERLPTSRFRMQLGDADTARLVAALEETRPTHVVCNEELDAPLAAAVARPAGDATWMTYGLSPPFTFERVRLLERWLGLPDADRDGRGQESADDGPFLVDAVDPHYGCELENELARTIRPFVQLVAGPGCLYHRPLARSEAFRELALDGLDRDFGCSFCGIGADTRYPYATPAVPLALKQLRRARATCPPERNEGHFVMGGAVLFHRLKDLLESVLAAGLPASEFLFACRIDELRRKAPQIEALLPRLAAAGHTMSIANMGVENFSPAENERFNKHVSEDDVAAVVENVNRWERDFPGAFRFWESGGFGFILFTPWTRIEDLRINLRAAERFGLHPDSFFFVSRVQLMPGRALTRLAERDGLVVPPERAAELAGFNSGCIMSAIEHELPWRFRHPEIGPLYGVFVRLRQANARGVAPDVPPDDPDYRRLKTLRARLPEEYRSPYRFLAAALDAAKTQPNVASVGALLDLVEARFTPLLGAVDEEVLRREAEAEAAAPPEQRESAADRDRRAFLEARLRELLPALARHPKRILLGFAPDAVLARPTGEGWGELVASLRRGDEAVRVRILPREVAPHGFATTPRFTIMHDARTPVDTDDKRRLLTVLARALERYVTAREAADGGTGDSTAADRSPHE